MKIAVLGTGSVGRTIAGRLAELGHDVVIGTRDPAATLARTEPDRPLTPYERADHLGAPPRHPGQVGHQGPDPGRLRGDVDGLLEDCVGVGHARHATGG